MGKKFSSAMCYGLGVILAAFYCIILWKGIHPEVSQEYRMYFIDRTIEQWPGNGQLHIEMGEPVNSEDGTLKHYLQDVWVEGSDGYMLSAADSKLIFCLSEEPKTDLLLTFLAGTGDRLPGNTVQVYMGDAILGECELTPQDQEYKIVLPKELLTTEYGNFVQFRAAEEEQNYSWRMKEFVMKPME